MTMTSTDRDGISRHKTFRDQIDADSMGQRRLLQHIARLGVQYCREDSFKLVQGQLLPDRILIGIGASDLSVEALFSIASDLGMPANCQAKLQAHLALASTVFFGVEPRRDGCVYKIYLEFWDEVCREVRQTGSRAPLLLHLGMKWDSERPEQHEEAHYTCYPMLNAGEVLHRMAAIYPPDGPPSACAAALAMVRTGIRNNPAASLLYLEAAENGNPRCSFDVNLYKTGLFVADIGPELRQAATHFKISAQAMEQQLQSLGHCLLGHISGGTNRQGQEFLSIYAES